MLSYSISSAALDSSDILLSYPIIFEYHYLKHHTNIYPLSSFELINICRKEIAQWHPDKFPDDAIAKVAGGLRMEKINRAYFCLEDEDRRRRYDLYGEKGVGTSASSEKKLKESADRVYGDSGSSSSTDANNANTRTNRARTAGAGDSEDPFRWDNYRSDYSSYYEEQERQKRQQAVHGRDRYGDRDRNNGYNNNNNNNPQSEPEPRRQRSDGGESDEQADWSRPSNEETYDEGPRRPGWGKSSSYDEYDKRYVLRLRNETNYVVEKRLTQRI